MGVSRRTPAIIPRMAFQPSSSSFTKARLVVCLVALAATVCLGAYHVRQAQTTDSFARPPIASRQAGPVLVEGPAGGTPFELPNGARVLVAHIEVRDRAPNKKGSALLCSRVLISHLTIDGHPIAWDPSAKTPSTRPPLVGGNHLGYIDLGRESPPLGLTQLTAAPAARFSAFAFSAARLRASSSDVTFA